jgi:hypothetical protein
MEKILLVDTTDPHTMIHGIVFDAARQAEIDISDCLGDECYERVKESYEYRAFLVNTSRDDAYKIASSCYRTHPGSQIIFVLDETAAFPTLEYAGTTGEIGNDWAVVRRNIFDLGRAMTTAIRANAQRKRFRTQLGAFSSDGLVQ